MNNIIDSIQLSGTTYQIQGGSIAVDTELDSGSTNPVQNKVIYNKIDEVEEVTAAGLNALDAKINPTVELTQTQYDALVSGGTVDPNTYYIITDAQAGDLTQYWTSAQTNSAITAAVSGKQDTLISGTSIKTINNESILGSGNIDIQGGGTIDPSLDSGSTNAVANSAITNAINSCAHIPVAVLKYKGYLTKIAAGGEGSNNFSIVYTLTEYDGITKSDNNLSFNLYPSFINGKRCVSPSLNNVGSFNLVETSAITTSVTSASTDSQVPSAKAVYDALGGGGSITVDTALDSGSTNPVQNKVIYNKIDEVEQVTAAGLNALNGALGGLKLVKLTQAEYNALSTKDSSTLYVIVN